MYGVFLYLVRAPGGDLHAPGQHDEAALEEACLFPLGVTATSQAVVGGGGFKHLLLHGYDKYLYKKWYLREKLGARGLPLWEHPPCFVELVIQVNSRRRGFKASINSSKV